MAKKKLKKSFKIFISIFCAVIVIATSLFFVFKNKKKNNNPDDVTNVSLKSHSDFESQQAINNLQYSLDFNGNYKFSSIIKIDNSNSSASNLSIVSDKNALLASILAQKKSETKNEIMTLSNGIYTLYDSNKIKETGIYYGTNNRTLIYVENLNGNIIFNNKKYICKYEISLTGLHSDIKNLSSYNKSTLFVSELFYNSENIEQYASIFAYVLI